MGGIVGLARMTDKSRGHNDETIGVYVYGADSGLDTDILKFLNMTADEFAEASESLDDNALAGLALEKAGKSDEEIAAFNKGWLDKEPKDQRHRELLVERIAQFAPGNTEIKTVLASIALDDWGLFRDKDLTQGPPRTAHLRSVAGIAGAARTADKARAYKCGKLGEYKYGKDSILDDSMFGAFKLDAEAFAEAAYNNPNDDELSEWVLANIEVMPGQISAYNSYLKNAGFTHYREQFLEWHDEVCPDRRDINTILDMMDYDDEISFGFVDLTRRPPRSPYNTTIGGVTALGRTIDKCRAHLSGNLGLYWFGEDSGLDNNVLEFLGTTQDEFTEAAKTNTTDEALVAWLGERLNKSDEEKEQFNHKIWSISPQDERQEKFLRNLVGKFDASRSDIDNFSAAALLDDEISFARLKAAN
jgi:hypothetical protein